MLDGLLLIDKPTGCTSHDVVQRARHALGQKRIGHCGTLDPDATRLTRFLISAPKVYQGTIRFGTSTDTWDASGEILSTHPIDALRETEVVAMMAEFVGQIEHQTPPYSAKKIKGVKLYELARQGEDVPEARKTVRVFEFSAAGALEDGLLPFRLSCASGTYARSLAHELGQRLGTGAHLASLRRIQVGGFHLEDAVSLDEIERAATGEAGAGWVAFDTIPLPFTDLEVDSQQERRLTHGQTILTREIDCEEGDWVKILNRRREFVAVGSISERIGGRGVAVVQPRIVFQ